jgi:hypothetical protein
MLHLVEPIKLRNRQIMAFFIELDTRRTSLDGIQYCMAQV